MALLMTCGVFMFMAYGSGKDENRVNIQSEQEIRDFLVGKWEANQSFSGQNIFYRFEVTNNQIKYWRRSHVYVEGGGRTEWNANPDEIVNYNIGAITSDSQGNKSRLLGHCELGDIYLQAGTDNNDSWLEIGNIDGDYYSYDITPSKGWENK